MKDCNTPANRKTGRMITKNLIVLLVFCVVCFFAIWSWFTSNQKADASGISIKAQNSGGLLSSFEEDGEYLSELTDNTLKAYPLVSSDGTSFFIPALNRTTGEPLLSGSGNYIKKRDAVSGSDYYEKDIYFKSDKPMKVYLTDESAILPKLLVNTDGTVANRSDFGDFSRNYIAGAARLAVFDLSGTGEVQKFVWAPNPSYQLSVASGFTPLELISEEASGWNPPSTAGWNIENYGEASNYYLWEAHHNKSSNNVTYQKTQMYYNSATGTYYGVVDVIGALNVDHMIYIDSSNSANAPTGNFTDYSRCSDTQRKQYILNQGTGNQIYVTGAVEGGYTADNRTWAKLYLDADKRDAFFGTYNRFQVLISYCPKNNNYLHVEDFVFYDKDNPSNVGGGVESAGAKGAEKYELNSSKNIVITGTVGTDTYGLAVSEDQTTLEAKVISGFPVTAAPEFLYEVIQPNEEIEQYRLRNVKTQKFLSVTDGSLSLSDTPTLFSVAVGTSGEASCPVLYSGSNYIAFSQNSSSFTVTSSASGANTNVYEGNSYTFNENGTPETSYSYINDSGTHTISCVTDLSTTQPVITLTKSSDGSYRGHIKIRVWAEGTDREAQTPLADGVFNIMLKFFGEIIETQ
ncbi:MAG: hypothetical protein ACI4GZ_06495 [Ruminococcus sp.]